MELLFDDMWVDRKAGVRRILGAARKEPAPVIGPETAWEDNLHGCHALFFDREEQRYKLWYRAYLEETAERETKPGVETSEQTPKRRVFICHALSDDGRRWTRPALGLTEFRGSRDNNIITEIDGGDSTFWNVVKDTADPDPARRYKSLGFNRSEIAPITGFPPGRLGVCVRYSPDGLHWPGPPRQIMDTTDLTDADCILGQREPVTGKWTAFLRPRTGPKRRFIGYSTSDDFDHWTYPRMLLTPDAGDAEWVEFYGLTVACLGRWRIGCLWVYHNNPEFSPMTVELVYSRDGLHYHRAAPGTSFIPLGVDGEFDSRMICTLAIIPDDDGVRFYYNGHNHEHGSDRFMPMQPGRPDSSDRRLSGVGLARVEGLNLRGLRADADGMVETKWLCNYGDAGVEACAEVDRDGWIRAELLDQYGCVIPGFAREHSHAQSLAGGRFAFTWGQGNLTGRYGDAADKDKPVGHVVKLRFHLHKATLFGFHVGAQEAMPPYTDLVTR